MDSKTLEELQVIVTASVDDAIKKLNKVNKSTDSTAKSFLKMAKTIGGAAVTGMIIKSVINVGKEFSNLAADAAEIDSKFDVVFGDAADTVNKWAERYSESVGRSVTDTKKFASEMGDLLGPLGFSKEATIKMSESVVELAGDLGSFNNMNTADVMRDIQTAMVGNYETTKKYGVVLNDTVVKQEALNKGLWDGKGRLSDTAKAQAALNLIIKGSPNAIGDLIRTQESAANVTRRLESANKDLGIALGTVINEGVTPMKAATATLVSSLADWIKKAHEANNIHQEYAKTGKIESDNMEALTHEYEKNAGRIKQLKNIKDGLKGYDEQFDRELASLEQENAAIEAQLALLKQKQFYAASDERYAKEKSEANRKAREEEKAKLDALQAAADAQALLNEERKKSLSDNELAEKFWQDELDALAEKRNKLDKNTEEYKKLQKAINLVSAVRNEYHSKVLADIEAEKQAEEQSRQETFDKARKDYQKRWQAKVAARKAAAEKEQKIIEEAAKAEAEAYQKALDNIKNYISEVSYFSSGVFTAISDIYSNMETAAEKAADAEIASTQKLWDDKIQAAVDGMANIQSIEDERNEALKNATADQYDAINAYYDDKQRKAKLSSDYVKGLELQETEAVKKAEDEKAKKIKAIKEKQWKADKAAALTSVAINTAEAIVGFLANPGGIAGIALSTAAGVLGGVQAGVIASQPMPAFATGGEFITNGPQAILVGDNPGGKERVSITPESSANVNGPSSGGGVIIINLDGNTIAEFVTDAIIDKKITIYEGSIVS